MRPADNGGFLYVCWCTAGQCDVSCKQRICLIDFHKGFISMLCLRAETAEKRAKALILVFILEVVIKVIWDLNSQFFLARQSSPLLQLSADHAMDSRPFGRSQEFNHQILNKNSITAPIAPVPPKTNAVSPYFCMIIKNIWDNAALYSKSKKSSMNNRLWSSELLFDDHMLRNIFSMSLFSNICTLSLDFRAYSWYFSAVYFITLAASLASIPSTMGT